MKRLAKRVRGYLGDLAFLLSLPWVAFVIWRPHWACWLLTGHARRRRFGRRYKMPVVERDGYNVAICKYCEHIIKRMGAVGAPQTWD